MSVPPAGEHFDYVSSTYERLDLYQLKLGAVSRITKFLFNTAKIGPINLERPSKGETGTRFSANADISLRLRKGEGYDVLRPETDYHVVRHNASYLITLKNLHEYNNGDFFQTRSLVVRTKDDILKDLDVQDQTNRIEIDNKWGFPVRNFAFTTPADTHKGQKFTVRHTHHAAQPGLYQVDRIELAATIPFTDQDWSKIAAGIPSESKLFLRLMFIELPPGKTFIEFQ